MKKKLLYGLAGLLVALSLVGFAACSDDDDDDDRDTNSYYTASGALDEVVRVTVSSSGVISGVTVDGESASKTSDSTVWTYTDDDGVEYTLTITVADGEATYSVSTTTTNSDGSTITTTQNADGSTITTTTETGGKTTTTTTDSEGNVTSTSSTYTASWGGDSTTETNALSGYTVTVCAEEEDVSSVTMTDGDGNTIDGSYSDYDNGNYIYKFIVDNTDDTSTVYTLTLLYDSESDAYTYTYTYVGTENLEASVDSSQTSIGTVVVKYNSESGIQAVTVNDNTAGDGDEDGTYTYSVDSDDGSTTTTYTLTVSVDTTGSSPKASYTYTYTTTTEGKGALSQTVRVTATSSGEITAVTVDGEDATASGSWWRIRIDSTWYYLTVSLDESTGGYTYSYEANLTATGAFDTASNLELRADVNVDITVASDGTATINHVSVASSEAGTAEADDDDNSLWTVEISDVTYTLKITVASGTVSYTTTVTADYAGDESDFTSLQVTYGEDGTASQVVVVLDGETHTISELDEDEDNEIYECTLTVGDTVYMISVPYFGGSTYDYNACTTVTATYGGDEGTTNALSEHQITAYVDVNDVGIVMVAVDGEDISDSYDSVEGTYTYTIDNTEYKLTFTVGESSGSYTVTYTYTGAWFLTASTTQESIGDVVVKYSSSSGITAVTVDDNTAEEDGDDGAYTYTISTSVYNEDYQTNTKTSTTYALTVSVDDTTGDTPKASYSYTYTRTLYGYYEGAGDIESVKVTVYAHGTETFDGSESTYEGSYYPTKIASSTDSDTTYSIKWIYDSSTGSYTYSFSVDGDESATVYTIDVSYSPTSTEAIFTYTYTSVTTEIYTATGVLDDDYTVKVYYNTTDATIEKVTINGTTLSESSSDNSVWRGSASSMWCSITITVESGEASYVVTSMNVNGSLWASTASGEGYEGSVTLTVPDGVSSIAIMVDSSDDLDTIMLYLGDWDWQLKFGDAGHMLYIRESGTSCDDWLYDVTNSSDSTELVLSDIMDDYDGQFTLYIWNSSEVDANYTVEYSFD